MILREHLTKHGINKILHDTLIDHIMGDGSPGHPLAEAVLRNNLSDAFLAVENSQIFTERDVFDLVSWLMLYAPQDSWGSVDRVMAWNGLTSNKTYWNKTWSLK